MVLSDVPHSSSSYARGFPVAASGARAMATPEAGWAATLMLKMPVDVLWLVTMLVVVVLQQLVVEPAAAPFSVSIPGRGNSADWTF